jgi:hypothetical protein
VQDPGRWYPPFEDRSKFLPLLPRGLAATNKNVTPQSIYAFSEDAQLIDVAGDSMVLVLNFGPKLLTTHDDRKTNRINP